MRSIHVQAGGFLAALCVLFAGTWLQAADAPKREPVMPAAFCMPDHTVHVFYRTMGGQIQELHSKKDDPRGWMGNDVIAAAGSPKAASNPAAIVAFDDNSEHVIYRGTDDQLHELFRSGSTGTWGHSNLSTATGTPKAVGDPAAYVASGDKSMHVVFRTDGGDICELFRASGAGRTWGSANLTRQSGAPKAAGDPCGFMSYNGKDQHVVFRTGDSSICELFFNPATGKWGQKNISNEARAPKAAGDPNGYVASSDKSLHVVFRGDAGNICELFRAAGSGGNWGVADLCKDTGAANASGDPCAFVENDGKTQHVVYRANDDMIHELFLSPATNKWGKNTIGSATRAAKAVGDPVTLESKENKTLHVFYVSNDDNLCELSRQVGEGKNWNFKNLTRGPKLPAGK